MLVAIIPVASHAINDTMTVKKNRQISIVNFNLFILPIHLYLIYIMFSMLMKAVHPFIDICGHMFQFHHVHSNRIPMIQW